MSRHSVSFIGIVSLSGRQELMKIANKGAFSSDQKGSGFCCRSDETAKDFALEGDAFEGIL